LAANPLNTLWDFSRLMWHTLMGVESMKDMPVYLHLKEDCHFLAEFVDNIENIY